MTARFCSPHTNSPVLEGRGVSPGRDIQELDILLTSSPVTKRLPLGLHSTNLILALCTAVESLATLSCEFHKVTAPGYKELVSVSVFTGRFKKHYHLPNQLRVTYCVAAKTWQ